MSLQRIVSELRRREHAVTIVRPRQNSEDRSREEDGVTHMTVNGFPLPGYDGLHFGLPCVGRLKQYFSETRPDIVHVATEGPLGWSAIRAAGKFNIALSSSFHTNFHAYGKYYGFGVLHRLALKYLRFVHNSTLATFAPSDDLLEDLRAEGFENLELLGRGVDTALFSPDRRDAQLRQEWGVTDEQPVAVYVGRIAKEKNIALTIKAYEAMRKKQPTLKLVLVGDGPERKRFEEAYPEIHFAGMRRGEDLARHYASADVFLFGSVTETFGNVVTEAMASGLVVLAYDYAAPGRYISSYVEGVLAPMHDEAQFIAEAESLADDKSAWKAMRVAAREKMLSLSWASIVEGFEKKLQTLAHSKKPDTLFKNNPKSVSTPIQVQNQQSSS